MISEIDAASGSSRAAVNIDAQKAAVRAALEQLKTDTSSARSQLARARQDVSRLRGNANDAGRDEEDRMRARQRDLDEAHSNASVDQRAVHLEFDSKINRERQDAGRRDIGESQQEYLSDKAKLAADRAALDAELERVRLKNDAEIQLASRKLTESRAALADAIAEHARELREAQRREQDALIRAQSLLQADTMMLEARRRAYVASGGKTEALPVTPVQSL